MKDQMPGPRSRRERMKCSPSGIFDNLIKAQVDNAVSNSVGQWKGLMAMRRALARQIRTTAAMLVPDDLAEVSARDFHRPCEAPK